MSIAPIAKTAVSVRENTERDTTHHALQSDGPRPAHYYPLPTICSPDTLLDKEISPASILAILSILSILSVTANRFSLRQQMLCPLRDLAQLSGSTTL